MNGDVEKMMKQPNAWAVVSEYGGVRFYWDKDYALDHVTRTDTIFRVQITGWEQESA